MTVQSDRYQPLTWLAGVGTGGLALFVFVFTVALIPDDGQGGPIAQIAWRSLNSASYLDRGIIVVGYVAFTGLALTHFFFAFWNVRRLSFRSGEYKWDPTLPPHILEWNAPILSSAISVQVACAAAAMFSPIPPITVLHLHWAGLILHLILGTKLLLVNIRYLVGIIRLRRHPATDPGVLHVLGSLAAAEVSVGLAASGAFAQTPTEAAIGFWSALLFVIISLISFIYTLVTGSTRNIHYASSSDNAVTLWLSAPVISILTVTMFYSFCAGNIAGITSANHMFGRSWSAVMNLSILLAAIFAAVLILVLAVVATNGLPCAAALEVQPILNKSVNSTFPVSLATTLPSPTLSVQLVLLLQLGLQANGLINAGSVAFYCFAVGIVAFATYGLTRNIRILRENMRPVSPTCPAIPPNTVSA